VCETPGCVAHIKCTGSIRRPHLCRVFIERTSIHDMQTTTDYPIAKQPSQKNPHASVSHQNTQVSYGPNRHNKSPIDATRALIGRALVLMTLNPFERVAVSLKPVSMCFTTPLLPRPLSSLSFHANKFSRDLWEWNLSCHRDFVFCSSI